MDQGLIAKHRGIYRLVKFFDENSIDFIPLRDPTRYLTYDHYISHLDSYFSSNISDGHFAIQLAGDVKSSAFTTHAGYNYIFLAAGSNAIDFELTYDIMRGMKKISNKWILDIVAVHRHIDVIKLMLPFINYSNSIKIKSSNILYEIDQRNLATYQVRNDKPFLKTSEESPRWDDKIIAIELIIVVDIHNIMLIRDVLKEINCTIYCPFIDKRNIMYKYLLTDNVSYRVRCQIPEEYSDIIRGDIPKEMWPYQ
jgi:hypothetical protein